MIVSVGWKYVGQLLEGSSIHDEDMKNVLGNVDVD